MAVGAQKAENAIASDCNYGIPEVSLKVRSIDAELRYGTSS